MGATVYLENPMGDEGRIECEEAKIIGDIVWASSEDGGQQRIVPLSNVTGVSGDTVEQEIEALEAPGGQFTELITDIC
jgi:hypothetical protein